MQLLIQGLANCIFILIDFVLNQVIRHKLCNYNSKYIDMQLYEERYANRLLSDPDQFIYNTSFLMKQCRSDITILMHLSICRHLNLKNVRIFF